LTLAVAAESFQRALFVTDTNIWNNAGAKNCCVDLRVIRSSCFRDNAITAAQAMGYRAPKIILRPFESCGRRPP